MTLEQPTATTERMLLFCCAECHQDRRGELVSRADLAGRLGRHRKEHPDHDQAILGYPGAEAPDA